MRKEKNPTHQQVKLHTTTTSSIKQTPSTSHHALPGHQEDEPSLQHTLTFDRAQPRWMDLGREFQSQGQVSLADPRYKCCAAGREAASWVPIWSFIGSSKHLEFCPGTY